VRRACCTFLAAVLVAGCASIPGADEFRSGVAALPDAALNGPVTDGRARFREIFCDVARRNAHVTQDDLLCDSLLWRLADEPAAGASSVPPMAVDSRLRVFVVTGAFSDCFGPDALPYRSGIARMTGAGYRIETIEVSGRSSAGHNARQIADALRAASPAESDRILLMGYSKGAIDILEFLDEYPDLAARVSAVVSIAGAVMGTPLAEKGEWFYRKALADTFAARCDPGDGGVLESLDPTVRRRWLADHPLPRHIAYLSLAAFTTREHLAHGLLPFWKMLAPFDPRNDGQILIGDAVIPGATLLGYANADHWSIALRIENELPHLAARSSGDQFPQDDLLEALVLFAAEALAAR